MENKIIVLQGVPASGKSTYARDLHKMNENYVIVNRDNIRESRGSYWIPSQEEYISSIEEFEVRSALDHNLIPIIDATNLNPKTIQKWENIAKEYNVEIEYKLFKIDYNTAIQRDKLRERPVGEKVIKRFFKDYFPEMLYPMDDKRFIQEPDKNKIDIIVCDIDGTVAMRTGRSPYDYSKVLTDNPDKRLFKILNQLNEKYHIIFLSGREGTERCYNDTKKWIETHFKPSCGTRRNWELIMRTPKDYRKDCIIKEEIYKEKIEPYYNVITVFDDRDQVVKMWRDLGILCCQVYYGDF